MKKMLKIRFALKGLIGGETLWAEDLGGNLFRLANIPVYAADFAIDDVVRCTDENGWKQVASLEKDSGNGTVRLLFNVANDSQSAKRILTELSSVGCSMEIASRQLVAVNIPPSLEIPFSQLSNYLNSLSHEILSGWEVAKRFKRS